MNEILLYKIIWKKIAMCIALTNTDVYSVTKTLSIINNKVYYIDNNKNIKISINREELYDRLIEEGFKIVENIDNENNTIKVQFSISRDKIMGIAKNSKEKKIK